MSSTSKKVWSMFFSPTGTTEKVTTAIARKISSVLDTDIEIYDFTLPGAREKEKSFGPDAIVVFGVPTYAGRVPNVLLKYLATVKGEGALAVPVVLYGNRNFDDSLIELRNILETNGFHTVAAGAFIGEHSFSKVLAAGRPDEKDMAIALDFAEKAAEKIKNVGDPAALAPVAVKGEDPIRTYYQPRDRQGNPVNILKVKPLTNDSCTDCKLCADVCPMGSISRSNVREYTGICIKCGACVKKCPMGAKYYEDEGYLYHKTELELGYERRAEPEYFL